MPAAFAGTGPASIVVVARPADRLGCWLQNGFGAVRAVQRQPEDGRLPMPVTVVVVTDAREDTAVMAGQLRRERIEVRLQGMTTAEAADVFGRERLPVIFLVHDGRVVSEWVGGGREPADLQRWTLKNAVVEASRAAPLP